MFLKDVGSANKKLMCCSALLLKNNIFMTVKDQLRESLTRVFTREGFQVVGVSSAEPAVALSQEGFFDLILTDIILPGITGCVIPYESLG